MAFDEVQFPEDIQWGMVGGPRFSTNVQESVAGYEFRNRNWAQALRRYDVSHGIRTQAEVEALIAFFRARNGSLRGFRFKDWFDFKKEMDPAISVSPTNLAVGDGTTGQTFSLVKTYSDSANSYLRPITKPIASTVILDSEDYVPVPADLLATYGPPHANAITEYIQQGQLNDDFSIDAATGVITWAPTLVETVPSTGVWTFANPGAMFTIGLSPVPVAGETIYFKGWTGANAGVVNNQRIKVIASSGGSLTLGIDLTSMAIDNASGTETIQSVPDATETIRVRDYEFDVPVRFSADELPVSIDEHKIYSASVEIIEIRDPAVYVTQPAVSSNFHEIRIDPCISLGATGGPRFKTMVSTLMGGHESRVLVWDQARAQYDVGYSLKDHSEFIDLLNFFHARWGRTFGFRFRDWPDYKLPSAQSNITPSPDSSTKLFKVVKAYTSGTETFNRVLTRLVDTGDEETLALSITVGGQVHTIDSNDFVFRAGSGGTVIPNTTTKTDTSTVQGGRLWFGLTPGTADGTPSAVSGDSLTINDISNGDPAVVTVDEDLRPNTESSEGSSIEGVQTGETIWLSGISGGLGTIFNNTRWTITRTGDQSFSIAYDTTLEAVYSSGGSATKIPFTGEVILVGGEFDVGVRFDIDDMNFTLENWGIHTWSSLPLKEIRNDRYIDTETVS